MEAKEPEHVLLAKLRIRREADTLEGSVDTVSDCSLYYTSASRTDVEHHGVNRRAGYR